MAKDTGDAHTTSPQQMTEEKFKSLTFPCNKDYNLGDLDLARGCPLDKSSGQRQPRYDIGDLDRLPLELQQAIFNQIDLRTLVNLRRVNKRAQEVIDSIPDYRNIVKHVPDPLRATLSIETASYTTCSDLWTALTTAECHECGKLGGLIYLLTCQRVCYPCNRKLEKYFPLSPSEAARCFGISSKVTERLPKMRSVPGEYTCSLRKCRNRVALVDRDSARQAGIRHHGSEAAMERHVNEKQEKLWNKYYARRTRLENSGSEGSVRRPNLISPSDRADGNESRFMAVIRVPFIKKVTMTVEQGRHCNRCRGTAAWQKEFTMATFAAHLEQHAQNEGVS